MGTALNRRRWLSMCVASAAPFGRDAVAQGWPERTINYIAPTRPAASATSSRACWPTASRA